MRPGKIARREHTYKRHGTLCLTANFDIVTGKIISPTIAKTRNEKDFAAHINKLLKTKEYKEAEEVILISDQLNTHKSESLVNLIIKTLKLDISEKDLGIKEKSGILKSMASRAKFLSDSSHKIRFVYTPKHCSWLNQIEIWFGILCKKLLNRNSFTSKKDLKTKILSFIKYFNQTMAKPFKWTFKGMPLRA